MSEKSKISAILGGLVGALCAVGPEGLFAQALLTPFLHGLVGNMQSPLLPDPYHVPAPSGHPAPSYPQTAEGFRAQISSAIGAYRQGETAEGRSLLDQFCLPRSTEWFAEYISPEEGEALTKRYQRLFESFATSLEKTLEDLVHAKHLELTIAQRECPCELAHVAPEPVDCLFTPGGIVPVKQPACLTCVFFVRSKGKAQFVMREEVAFVAWWDTFAYQDGAFRFVGFGGWPFWVWAEGSEGESPMDGHIVGKLKSAYHGIPSPVDNVIATLKP